jgi:hypothetical protein
VDLPEGAWGGALHAYYEFGGIARDAIHGIGDDAGHDGPDEAHAHDDHDFAAQEALFIHDPLETPELLIVVGGLG